MSRYIDADKLIERHCEGCSNPIREGCKKDPICASLMWVVEEPTADVVEVVRCKDCKHFFRDSCFNKVWGEGDPVPEVNKNDFCSYGERKC